MITNEFIHSKSIFRSKFGFKIDGRSTNAFNRTTIQKTDPAAEVAATPMTPEEAGLRAGTGQSKLVGAEGSTASEMKTTMRTMRTSTTTKAISPTTSGWKTHPQCIRPFTRPEVLNSVRLGQFLNFLCIGLNLTNFIRLLNFLELLTFCLFVFFFLVNFRWRRSNPIQSDFIECWLKQFVKESWVEYNQIWFVNFQFLSFYWWIIDQIWLLSFIPRIMISKKNMNSVWSSLI